MRIVRAVSWGLVLLVGVAGLGLAVTGWYFDGRLGERAADGVVILSAEHRVDVEFSPGAGERTRTTVWRGSTRPLIGDVVAVEFSPDHPGLARLAGDGRIGAIALVAAGAGVVLLLLTGLRYARRRRRRPGAVPV